MAKLTAKGRKSLKSSQFAGPGRSFPIEDDNHARKALQLAPRSFNAGNISKDTEESIKAKARAKLGNGKKRDVVKSAVKGAAKRLKHT